MLHEITIAFDNGYELITSVRASAVDIYQECVRKDISMFAKVVSVHLSTIEQIGDNHAVIS